MLCGPSADQRAHRRSYGPVAGPLNARRLLDRAWTAMPSVVDYAAGHAWVVHAVPGVDLLLVRVGNGPARTRSGTARGPPGSGPWHAGDRLPHPHGIDLDRHRAARLGTGAGHPGTERLCCGGSHGDLGGPGPAGLGGTDARPIVQYLHPG